MKAYCEDGLYFAYYGNDTTNTRTYKLSMTSINAWLNGGNQDFNFVLQQAMFYPNSYLNFNSNGYYTKHYYNGMERIASKLGDQNISINVNDPELQDRKDWQDSLIRKNVTEITGYEFLPVGEEQNPEDPKPIFELPVIGISNLQPSADGIYYYHPNHLGSTCYVTDGNASVQQGFLYAPFGEITNEYNNSFGSSVLPKYSFNAKELDEETGMYYYEARYYAPPVFISRDPLFEKYPTFSPYAYCANNLVMFIDPDGRDWYRNDETSSVIWSNNSDKKNDFNGESFRNIGKSFSKYVDGIRIIYGNSPDDITSFEKADPQKNIEGGQYIPKQFTTDDGTVVSVSFDKGADNSIDPNTVSSLIKSVNEANNTGANISSLHVSSTSNHTSNKTKSAHSHHNGARAIDISMINKLAVNISNPRAKALQEAIKNTPGWLENYGPFIIEKMQNGKVIHAPWARTCCSDGHKRHIHLSTPK